MDGGVKEFLARGLSALAWLAAVRHGIEVVKVALRRHLSIFKVSRPINDEVRLIQVSFLSWSKLLNAP